jgi:hypothetical protein
MIAIEVKVEPKSVNLYQKGMGQMLTESDSETVK